MRAREGLACELWTMGRGEEAVDHLQEMLRLNPNDNQGVRYTLASFLLNLNRDEEAGPACSISTTTPWRPGSYSKALLAFRSQGDTPEARQLLMIGPQAEHVRTGILAVRGAGPAREAGPLWAGGSQ